MEVCLGSPVFSHIIENGTQVPQLCPHAPSSVLQNQPPSMRVQRATGKKLRYLLVPPSFSGEMGLAHPLAQGPFEGKEMLRQRDQSHPVTLMNRLGGGEGSLVKLAQISLVSQSPGGDWGTRSPRDSHPFLVSRVSQSCPRSGSRPGGVGSGYPGAWLGPSPSGPSQLLQPVGGRVRMDLALSRAASRKSEPPSLRGVPLPSPAQYPLGA